MDVGYILTLILHTIFVSMPEQLFLIIFSLTLINRQDAFTKLNTKKVLKLVISSAILALLSILMRSLGGLDMRFMTLLGIFAVFAAIIIGYGIRGAKKIGALFGAVIISIICEMSFQLVFVSLALYGTSVSLEELGKPELISFIWSLPVRTLEVLLISVIQLNKICVHKIKIRRVIWHNRFLTWSFLLLIIFDFGIIYSIVKSIFLDRLFVNMQPYVQITILACGIIAPLITTSLFLFITYIFADRKKDEHAFMISEAKVLKELINIMIKEGRYLEIPEVMNDYNLLVENCSVYMQRKGLKI